MDKFDVRESIIAQRHYCEKHKLPHFAPFDGICFRCHNNIYTKRDLGLNANYISPKMIRFTGITVEEAGSRLITGCPHCNYSFCE